MSYAIKVDEGCRQTGMIEGTVSHYAFYAKVSHDSCDGGMDSSTLQKGRGRVIQLCIYRDEMDSTGDPYRPMMSIKRHIYVDYDGEWKIYNFTFQNMVAELVQYLERRGMMEIIR